MNADPDFLAAIRANPDDDALRLVYADWLEERGDPRGEFLRLDTELACESKGADRSSGPIARLIELRRRLDRAWVVTVGRAGFGEAENLELSGESEYLERPDWAALETTIRRLDRAKHSYVAMILTEDEESFIIYGGDGLYELSGGIGNLYWVYFDSSKSTKEVLLGGRGSRHPTPEQEICDDLETVLRAAKYVYYYREFPPDLPHRTEVV